MFTQLAKRFSARVWIGLSDQGPWTDAKSIVRVMALKASRQTTVFFAAEGADAADAVSALVRLVQSDFTSSKDQ
jgi:phosphocarrier protein